MSCILLKKKNRQKSAKGSMATFDGHKILFPLIPKIIDYPSKYFPLMASLSRQCHVIGISKKCIR